MVKPNQNQSSAKLENAVSLPQYTAPQRQMAALVSMQMSRRAASSSSVSSFVRSIRAAPSPEAEKATVSLAMYRLRTSIKKTEPKDAADDLATLLYLSILGYDVSFAQMACIKYLAASISAAGVPASAADVAEAWRPRVKRLAYLCLSCFVEPGQLIFMATNSIQVDLQSRDQYSQAWALATLGAIGTPQMVRELIPTVVPLCQHENSYLRKKALLVVARSLRVAADTGPQALPVLGSALASATHSTVLTAAAAASAMLAHAQSEEALDLVASALPRLARVLLSLVTGPAHGDHAYAGLSDPWLQAALLRLMAAFCRAARLPRHKAAAVEHIAPVLVSVLTRPRVTAPSRLLSAVIAEAAAAATALPGTDASLLQAATGAVALSLDSADSSLRAAGLEALAAMLGRDTNTALLQRHRPRVTELAASARDHTVQRRAIHVLFKLISADNVRVVLGDVVALLPSLEPPLRAEAVALATEHAVRFAPSERWLAETLIKLLLAEPAGLDAPRCVPELVTARAASLLVAAAPEVRTAIAHRLLLTLPQEAARRAYARVAVRVLGVAAPDLVASGVATADDVLAAVSAVLLNPQGGLALPLTRAACLTALGRLSAAFPDHLAVKDTVARLLADSAASADVDTQSRAVELAALLLDTRVDAPLILAPAPPRRYDDEDEDEDGDGGDEAVVAAGDVVDGLIADESFASLAAPSTQAPNALESLLDLGEEIPVAIAPSSAVAGDSLLNLLGLEPPAAVDAVPIVALEQPLRLVAMCRRVSGTLLEVEMSVSLPPAASPVFGVAVQAAAPRGASLQLQAPSGTELASSADAVIQRVRIDTGSLPAAMRVRLTWTDEAGAHDHVLGLDQLTA
jgi:hypothetical protein